MFEREDDLEVRWELGTASELLAALASNPVDVVLLDLNLGPDEDSLGTTRTILATWPDTKVIIISASVEDEFAEAARSAGASGYLPKDLPLADTIAAVRILAADGSTPVLFGAFLEAGQGNRRSNGASRHGLTKREQDVLGELRRGRTNRDIAARLGVSVTTVNKHVQQVLKKLHVRNRAEAVARLHAEASGGGYQGTEARSRSERRA